MTKENRKDYLVDSNKGWQEWEWKPKHKHIKRMKNRYFGYLDYKKAKTNVAFLTGLAIGFACGIIFTFYSFR